MRPYTHDALDQAIKAEPHQVPRQFILRCLANGPTSFIGLVSEGETCWGQTMIQANRMWIPVVHGLERDGLIAHIDGRYVLTAAGERDRRDGRPTADKRVTT